MSQRPFRFLHAADLHLDDPVAGLADIPPHLVDLLVDCPLAAARRVFDAAIEQHVDFVVLAGDIVDLNRAASRELTFLVEQFERLAQKNMAVYWAGGAIDSADWPPNYSLPGNVMHASRLHVQRHRHTIDGQPICELVGRSHDRHGSPMAREFAGSSDDLFSIAVVHAKFAAGLGDLGIEYWALGGLHGPTTLHQSAQSLSHYPGSPQGRNANEAGAHLCTLVQVDEQRQVRLSPIATDVIRWESPVLALDVAADRTKLERALHDRTAQMIAESGGATLLIEWRVSCDGAIFNDLRRGKLTAELLGALRREFGNHSPAAWTVAIQPELPPGLPIRGENEETLRGDYLRAIAELLHDKPMTDSHSIHLDADSLLSEDNAAWQLPQLNHLAAALAAPAPRRRVLQQAVWLGTDLLSPEESAR
ncbi:MAG: metallophosphoesterase [Pirellulales bacterium]|nr:metallophosphoesterase [Pirellulales bacterium]